MRGHVTNAAYGDHHSVIGRAQHVLQVLKRRNFLEQFSFGIRIELLQAGGGNLKMEGAPIGRLALHQQR